MHICTESLQIQIQTYTCKYMHNIAYTYIYMLILRAFTYIYMCILVHNTHNACKYKQIHEHTYRCMYLYILQ